MPVHNPPAAIAPLENRGAESTAIDVTGFSVVRHVSGDGVLESRPSRIARDVNLDVAEAVLRVLHLAHFRHQMVISVITIHELDSVVGLRISCSPSTVSAIRSEISCPGRVRPNTMYRLTRLTWQRLPQVLTRQRRNYRQCRGRRPVCYAHSTSRLYPGCP